MLEIYDDPRPWTGDVQAPLVLFESRVRAEWLDAFEHVNTAHFLTICDHANWAFWNWINGPQSTIEARDGREYVIVQSGVTYIEELSRGTPIHVTTQLLNIDDKRFILFHHLWKSEGNVLAATNEVKCLAFNLTTRRPESWRPIVKARLEQIHQKHATLPVSDAVGKGIALKRK